MKTLHIAYTTRWGAGKSLYRFHQELINQQIDSRILVADPAVPAGNRIHHFSELMADPLPQNDLPLANKLSYQACAQLDQSPLLNQADVVEVRQLHAGRQPDFFNLNALSRIARKKPLVWRLSDTWAFTGACAYPYDCDGWRHGCLKCPFRTSPEKTESRIPPRNTIWLDYLAKAFHTIRTPMDIVCPSHWMLECARNSFLRYGHKRFHFIPGGVDTGTFSGQQRVEQRSRLGFTGNDLVLLINSPDIKNHRKGADLLIPALKQLDTKSMSLFVIGKKAFGEADQLFKKVVCTGYLDRDAQLAAAYAAADVFLFPSRQDNSAQVLLEASASGLPIVAFNTGGNADYVHDKKTGFLVPLADTNALGQAITTLVQNPDLRRQFGFAGQDLMRTSFTMKQQTDAFIRLYESVADVGRTA